MSYKEFELENLGEYDFDSIYAGKEGIDFRKLIILLEHGIELDFMYNGKKYFIVYGVSGVDTDTDFYTYFGKCGDKENEFCCRVCSTKNKKELYRFLEHFEIEKLTLREIFDTKMSFDEKAEDNCIMRRA